jgi:hypothetical protein
MDISQLAQLAQFLLFAALFIGAMARGAAAYYAETNAAKEAAEKAELERVRQAELVAIARRQAEQKRKRQAEDLAADRRRVISRNRYLRHQAALWRAERVAAVRLNGAMARGAAAYYAQANAAT